MVSLGWVQHGEVCSSYNREPVQQMGMHALANQPTSSFRIRTDATTGTIVTAMAKRSGVFDGRTVRSGLAVFRQLENGVF